MVRKSGRRTSWRGGEVASDARDGAAGSGRMPLDGSRMDSR